MRIIAGQWRGRPIIAPSGQATRPTSDRAREGLFSMLASRIGSFEGLKVGDLFAGSGALGFEALSRGAAHCTFIEKDRAAVDSLKANIARLGAADRIDLRAQSVEHAPAPDAAYDLIFMDPPYQSGLGQVAVDKLDSESWLAPGGWISLELHNESLDLPARMVMSGERRFGKAKIILIQRPA